MEFASVEWHERLTSTNSVLLEWVRQGRELASGFVVAARQQTSGRGRYDRKWVAPAGKNLTFSFLLATGEQAEKMVSLTMAVALGVAEALEGFGVEAHTKWPNDVLVAGRKICGILAELPPTGSADENSCTPRLQIDKETQAPNIAVVLGVGLNVNMSAEVAASIDRPVTSILLETGEERPVESVLQPLLSKLEYWCSRWAQGGFETLKSTWCSRCEVLGDEVQIRDGGSTIRGVVEGFGDRGQLCLRLPDGRVTEVWSGDLDAGRQQ